MQQNGNSHQNPGTFDPKVGDVSRITIACMLTMAICGNATAKSKVMVFPIVPIRGEVNSAPAEQMTKAIMQEMAGAFEVVAGVALDQTAASKPKSRRPARSDGRYREALADIKEGEKQATHLRFPQAIRALNKGIDGLIGNLDMLGNYDELIDAHLLLAECHFRRGKQSEGADTLEKLARLRPDYELKSGKYPPVFTTVFNEARLRALAGRRGTLEVTSSPSGAAVVLNGKQLGETPLLVSDVTAGTHHLVVRHLTGNWGQTVTVNEGQTTKQHADIGPTGSDGGGSMGDTIARNSFDDEVRKVTRGQGKDQGADYVLVSAMGTGSSMFFVGSLLGEVKSGRWVRLPQLSLDLDLLSDTIEAHTLSREVGKQLASFGPVLGNTTVPLIDGKSAGVAGPSGGDKETRVAFIAPGYRLSTSSADRAAVRTVPQPAGSEPVAAVSPESRAPVRGPIGARVPIAALPSEPAPEPLPEPARPPREPLSRSSAGPVVAAEFGVETVVDPEIIPIPNGEVAAVSAESQGIGPLVPPTVAPIEQSDESIFERWWFWTAVGAVVAGGTVTTVLLLNGGDADSMVVRAVW